MVPLMTRTRPRPTVKTRLLMEPLPHRMVTKRNRTETSKGHRLPGA